MSICTKREWRSRAIGDVAKSQLLYPGGYLLSFPCTTMNGVGSSMLSYLQYLTETQPMELYLHSNVMNPRVLKASKARLDDPDYIRHDPLHAALAQQEIRMLDRLLDFYDTLDQADEEELKAVYNKIAEVTLRIIDYESVSRRFRLSCTIGF